MNKTMEQERKAKSIYQKFIDGDFKDDYFQLWSPKELWRGSSIFTTVWYLGGFLLLVASSPLGVNTLTEVIQGVHSISRGALLYGLPYTLLSALAFSYFSSIYTKRRRNVTILNAVVYPVFFVPFFYGVSSLFFLLSKLAVCCK